MPKRCRYTTLRNISFQKLHRPKTQQRQTRDAHTAVENVTVVGELVLKLLTNKIQNTNPLFSRLNSTLWCRTNHFHHDIGLKCLERRLLEN